MGIGGNENRNAEAPSFAQNQTVVVFIFIQVGLSYEPSSELFRVSMLGWREVKNIHAPLAGTIPAIGPNTYRVLKV